ncbi:MAG: phage major capsid protein [Acidobacteriota bacterium]|nr:phage major capsid protein [Acidobacteriota bacterium]
METSELKSVQDGLKAIDDQIKDFTQKHKSAIEDAGKLSKEAKAQADDLLTRQGETITAQKGILDRLQDQEQKLAKLQKDGIGAEDDTDTVGHALRQSMESGGLKAFQSKPSLNARIDIPVSRKALTNTGVTGAALNYPGDMVLPRPLGPLVRRLTIRDLLAPGRTSKSVIFYPRESGFTSNAAPVSEGSLKPKSDITFELITEHVRTIAHLMDISLQMLDDVEFIESYITGRMIYQLKLVEEAQLLTGSGTGQNLEGIYTAATLYANTTSIPNETDIDKLRLALLQVELAEANATGIILNPTDWAKIELLKETTGGYIFSHPQNVTTPRLWGRDVVSTSAMTAGRFLVGDFAAHAQIFDRQDANVAISFENKDNFERNLATLRVEERLALAIYRPEAFVKGRLETATGPNASL